MEKKLSILLVFALLFISVMPVSAESIPSPKEEVVYGILDSDGSVNNIYVVNIFNGGEVTDYGNYSEIRNMTTSEKLSQNGDQITINTAADKFYYQGTLISKELPWDISIKYFIDGKEIHGSELPGKSGKLRIAISVKHNRKINRAYFDNYALQIAISLDNKLCSNIKTENATIAEAGGKKQLSYTVLPGKETDIALTADVNDFEMEPISINGIKLYLGIKVDTDEFTKQISELSDAIKRLDGGSGEILGGLNQLSKGMQKYMDGMKAMNYGLAELSGGAEKLDTGATALSGGLAELAKQNDSIMSGALAIQQAAFDSVNAKLGEMGMGKTVLTPENYSAILSSIPNLSAVKRQLDGAVQFTQGLKSYTDGVAQLGIGASDLARGTSEFKSSSSVIAASVGRLYNAGEEINTGMKKLREALTLYKNGTNELKNKTSDMDSKISGKIDEMIDSIAGKGGKVISFVADKNTNVSAVQFVLKTDSIKLPEAQKVVASKPAEPNFWQKLLKLFSFINW